jgi:hypothetical protein
MRTSGDDIEPLGVSRITLYRLMDTHGIVLGQ